MYEKGPNAEQLAAFGLSLDDIQTDPIQVWPDNVDTVNAFIAMSTQWRIGMAGATGLDYGVLPGVLKMIRVKKRNIPDIFEGIRLMERVALDEMKKD